MTHKNFSAAAPLIVSTTHHNLSGTDFAGELLGGGE